VSKNEVNLYGYALEKCDNIAHPELGYEEHRTHDVLTAFMGSHGFKVTQHYHLETAWLATYSHGTGGRTIGINSEVFFLIGYLG
jgi:hypothetical protein